MCINFILFFDYQEVSVILIILDFVKLIAFTTGVFHITPKKNVNAIYAFFFIYFLFN